MRGAERGGGGADVGREEGLGAGAALGLGLGAEEPLEAIHVTDALLVAVAEEDLQRGVRREPFGPQHRRAPAAAVDEVRRRLRRLEQTLNARGVVEDARQRERGPAVRAGHVRGRLRLRGLRDGAGDGPGVTDAAEAGLVQRTDLRVQQTADGHRGHLHGPLALGVAVGGQARHLLYDLVDDAGVAQGGGGVQQRAAGGEPEALAQRLVHDEGVGGDLGVEQDLQQPPEQRRVPPHGRQHHWRAAVDDGCGTDTGVQEQLRSGHVVVPAGVVQGRPHNAPVLQQELHDRREPAGRGDLNREHHPFAAGLRVP
mmetsp:Transcript_32739/g.53421  ORF Transcript_32739/g.53421 Transcript_32739/m.53421 type:complete len:312 (+) Transcript_32739:1590-2525(+)